MDLLKFLVLGRLSLQESDSEPVMPAFTGNVIYFYTKDPNFSTYFNKLNRKYIMLVDPKC